MQKNLTHLFFREGSLINTFLRVKLLVLIMFFSITLVSAKSYAAAPELQQFVVTGTVTDQQGLPAIGVTVLVKGTTIGTLTDVAGKYTLTNIPPNDTLVFTFVGMTSQQIPLNGQTRIDVVMQMRTLALDDVVIVGYGVQKKESFVGAISQTTN